MAASRHRVAASVDRELVRPQPTTVIAHCPPAAVWIADVDFTISANGITLNERDQLTEITAVAPVMVDAYELSAVARDSSDWWLVWPL